MTDHTDGTEPDALHLYRQKRDPRVTNEPFGVALDNARETSRGQFVIHLHAATRRHHDLRLQVGSTLKSFAVPRGPSLDPNEKRLAVQTEDHPLEYIDFEDVIPEGNYGAGPMIVWDIGIVQFIEQPAEVGLSKGKLDFLLFGHKVRGRFALVETTQRVKPRPKQRQWLLLKKTDAHAKPGGEEIIDTQPESVFSGLCVEQLVERDELRTRLFDFAQASGAREGAVDYRSATPMLCANEGARLDDPERAYELKLDGVRILAERSGSEVRLKYRKQRSATESYPEVVRALGALLPDRFIMDGEIVSFDERGKPSFQRLAPRIHATRPHDVKRAAVQTPVVYLAFDLLQLGPYDLRGLPLSRRKELLSHFVPKRGVIRFLDHLEGNGTQLYQLCKQQGLEGVVSKRLDSRYRFGPERSEDWVKHKCEREDRFVVVGWVEGRGARAQLGALELGSYQKGKLTYCGRVGSGLDDAALVTLSKRLRELETKEWNVAGDPIEDGKKRHAVEPVLVANVRYLEWTNDKRVRMAVFLGLDASVPPRACIAAPEEERVESALATSEESVETLRRVSATPEHPRRFELKNQGKVFWPEEGYTKGDLLHYYEQVADVLLPHLIDRPIMLVRYPDGIEGKNFYQWNIPQGTPSWVKTLELRHEERDGKNVTTFLVEDVDSLLYIINLGCIPVHVLACRQQSLEQCDFLTIDFDLGGQPFTEAVLLALGLKELLDELGLFGFPKTSGQSGLHVLIPTGPGVPFPIAKVLVELLGRLLQLRHPDASTMQRRVSERGERVYIDTGQTGRSRTIVSPYSVRAHRGGTVSTPLSWDEVHLALRPEVWTMFTVPDRVRERGDPMAELLAVRPDVLGAVAKLEKMVR